MRCMGCARTIGACSSAMTDSTWTNLRQQQIVLLELCKPDLIRHGCCLGEWWCGRVWKCIGGIYSQSVRSISIQSDPRGVGAYTLDGQQRFSFSSYQSGFPARCHLITRLKLKMYTYIWEVSESPRSLPFALGMYCGELLIDSPRCGSVG